VLWLWEGALQGRVALNTEPCFCALLYLCSPCDVARSLVVWTEKKNKFNLWVVGYWVRELFGLCICNLSISVEQTEMRGPKIILKPQRALILLCSCHDFIFIAYIFLHSAPAHPLSPSFRRNSGWEVSQPFSQLFAVQLQFLGLFDIFFSPLASLHRIRLISYYYCPGKSYALRRKDILTFITIFCDL